MTKVSKRFQVVIERAARKKLGIHPGWVAVQTVVGDHLEMRFLPPEHNRSLAGSLNSYARGPVEDYATEKGAGWLGHVEAEWSTGARTS
jgi:bifunctional DNA-binding transcriptional regulator/antitoxin component of YhaV-PrlF toxin-antitoxin module